MKGRISKPCRKMVKNAAEYIAKESVEEANILIDTFNEIAANVCKYPEMGRPFKNKMRKIRMGKFRYYIYYKVTKDKVYFLGIWHTRRGTEFAPC
jgi:plasmid stabilization system protein ParE